MRQTYLGDGVYVGLEAGTVVLTWEGENRIALGREVLAAFLQWINRNAGPVDTLLKELR